MIRRPKFLFAALVGLTSLSLASCMDDAPTPDQTAAAANDPAAGYDPNADIGSSELDATDGAMSTPMRSPVGNQAAASCATEIGQAPAQQFADQCRRISPATRPPCNVANSCAMIRAEIARGCAMLGKDAIQHAECGGDPYGPETAVAAIQRYYSAINSRDYGTAYATWGNNGRDSGLTLTEFAKGYAQTRSSRVTVGEPSAIEAAAGSLYVTLPVTVEAVTTSGEIQRFTGRYVMREPNVGVAVSQGWHIQSAALKEAG